MKEMPIKSNNMTIEQIKQDYYYHCSFEFQDGIVQMWINKTEDNVCLYMKNIELVLHFDADEIHVIGNILHTAGNCFFQRRMLKEREQREKIND